MWAVALACSRKTKKRKVAPSVGVRVIGDRAEERVAGARREGSDLDALLKVPAESAESAGSASAEAPPLSLPDLETRSSAVCTAMRVYKRAGDAEKARELAAEYKRLRREIRKRRRA